MMFNETLLLLLYSVNLMASPWTVINDKNNGKIEVDTLASQSSIKAEEAADYDDEWYMWRCYQPYGCFYIGTPWSGASRPVTMFPQRPDSIKPIFRLFTRQTLKNPHELLLDNLKSIYEAPLRSQENIYFIIHGYLDSGNKTWILKLMREILQREEANVVIVSWVGGAGPPYTQAVANTRVVGAMVARLASQLIKKGHLQPNRMHCIGHSLGAHTCGYVGYNLRVQYGYKLEKITGLDPAEPHFSNTSPIVRLDPSDANFVTAIHTDCSPFISGGLGISQAVAHIDFYPNGGKNQPGCNEGVFNSISLEKGSFFRGLKRFLGCNHIRSYEYFIESINTACPYLAVPCDSWEKFKNGSCFNCIDQYCPRFGFNTLETSEKILSSVFLMTGKEEPFCRAHYLVTINISKSNESLDYGGEVGMFAIRVFGTNDQVSDKISLDDYFKYYEPGFSYTAVVSGNVIEKPEKVEITWEYQTQIFNPLTWRINKPKAFIDSLVLSNLEFKRKITVCPRNLKPLIANEPVMLHTHHC